MDLKKLIDNKDYKGIRFALESDPRLANEGLPYDEQNTAKAHPLHRICDGVFNGLYTDEDAVELAKLFLEYGAYVDGVQLKEKQDTPLVAAASLQADRVGLLYIERGADIHHAGCSGGTALHWAAWCGRDKLVRELIARKADLEKKCLDHESTPLFWAIHGYKFGGEKNRFRQIECARMLVESGAVKNTYNVNGTPILSLLDETDGELRALLS